MTASTRVPEPLWGRSEAIASLLARYARAVDGRDIDLLASLFSPTAVLLLDRGRRIEGRAAIRDEYAASFASTRATKHLIGNIEIVGEDPLTSSAALVVHGFRDGVVTLAWGQYRHEYTRVDGEWYIANMSISLEVPFIKIEGTTRRGS